MKQENLTLPVLLIGGGLVAAALMMSKPGPAPGTNAQLMFNNIKNDPNNRTKEPGGVYRYILTVYPTASSTITGATDSNGNITTYRITFPDVSMLNLYTDLQNEVKMELVNESGAILNTYTEPGFEQETRPDDLSIATSYTVGRYLRAYHIANAANDVRSEFGSKIRNSTDSMADGMIVTVFSFNDGSELRLEVDSSGYYAYTAISSFGSTLDAFTEANYRPYVPPNNITASKAYLSASSAYQDFLASPVSMQDIANSWERVFGAAGGVTLHQDIRGVRIHNVSYNVTVYQSTFSDEPAFLAELTTDINNIPGYERFTIEVSGQNLPTLTIIDTFPNPSAYDRTKTVAYSVYLDMYSMYLHSDNKLLTPAEVLDEWGRHCLAEGGRYNSTLAGTEYTFSDQSSAKLYTWPDCPRQFRITMSSTAPGGDTNYELLRTDFWRKSIQTPLTPVADPHTRLASFIANYDKLQSANRNLKGFMTINNIVTIMNELALKIADEHNGNRAVFTSKLAKAPEYGPLDPGVVALYQVYYVLFTGYSYKYACFVRYELIDGKFYIRIDTIQGNRYNSHGIDTLTIRQMWDWIVLNISRQPYYITNGFHY